MRSRCIRVGFLISSLAIATLACARADVPAPRGIGSGGLLSPTEVLPTPLAEVTDTSEPAPAAEATVTPFEPEPVVSPTFPPTPTLLVTEEVKKVLYTAQPGDTLRTVAIRFGVLPADIESADPLPGEQDLIDPDQLLFIPKRYETTTPAIALLPDSELVFSPHATDFDVVSFTAERGGYLTQYREYVGTGWLSGAEIVSRVARDNSVNPRILLALLEYQARWISDPTQPSGEMLDYPLGFVDVRLKGLSHQLTWLANELGNGYYGWRAGTLTELRLQDGVALRLAPDLNAGTVALQYIFSLFDGRADWAVDVGREGIIATYTDFFGDPWAYVHPLYELGVEQPELVLPFIPGHRWAYTGGPHGAWERESAWAAIDFAPASQESGCVVSNEWVVAAADGFVVRSGEGVVVLDLDGDGREQSGWSLLYLHVAEQGRVEAGIFIERGDLIGHPSCEGGTATGTHIHLARKYNGEWILADGPLAFKLSGWIALAGSKPYQGALVKGDQTVYACPCATQETLIER